MDDTARRVLIVDDEESFVRTMTRWLGATYTVASATTERTALDLITHGSFDAVIADVHIGDDSGVDLLKQVRQVDVDLPVIMISGVPALSSALKLIELQAFRYLVKPFERDELASVLRQAVAAHDAAAARRAAVKRFENEAAARRKLAVDLERALKTLFIAHQPIVRHSTHQVFAFEALLRTEDQALPNPGAVLSAAEELGEVHALGRRVRQLAAGETPPCEALLFVNLHVEELLDGTLYDDAAPLSRLAKHVVLEITERSALHGVSEIRERADALRKLGYRIAVDDLGEGYAGLSSLSRLEPEVIKLDMSIIRGIERSRPNQRLVRSMVVVAKDAGAELVAEGVETAAERDALLEIGVDLFQGFLYARPGRAFPAVTW